MLVCDRCGSSKVQVSAWIDANTNEVLDTDGPVSYAYCAECQDDTELVDEDEFEPREPRELTIEQQKFRVDLHTEFGGAYGYGETMEEADRNARFFYKRDFDEKPMKKRIAQRRTESGWEVEP